MSQDEVSQYEIFQYHTRPLSDSFELKFRLTHAHHDGYRSPIEEYAPAPVLLSISLCVAVFITVWNTRGIRRFADLSSCAFLAIGMSAAAIFYFAAANATFVGVGINNTGAVTCNTIGRALTLVYLSIKGYVWVFFGLKLCELIETTRLSQPELSLAKESYGLYFSPVALAYGGATMLMCIYLDTALWHTGYVDTVGSFIPTYSHCILHVSHPTIILPIIISFIFIFTLVLVLVFTNFLGLFQFLTTTTSSLKAAVGCVIVSLGPVIVCIYFIHRDGHGMAPQVLLLNSADILLSLIAVWFTEGSWGIGRCHSCICLVPVVNLEKLIKEELKQDARRETEAGMQSRVARMARVRRLHQELRRDEDMVEEIMGEEEEEIVFRLRRTVKPKWKR